MYTNQNKCKNDDVDKRQELEYKSQIPEISKILVNQIKQCSSIKKIGCEKIPSKESIIEIIQDLQKIFFPGYYGEQDLTTEVIEYHIGINLFELFDKLSNQISKSFRHKCESGHYKMCFDCYSKGIDKAMEFIKQIPELRKLLCKDVTAAFNGDPAAESIDEIIFSYPGFKAVFVYRIAHCLYKLDIPLLPRIMTEYAHSETGIDIHPGAEINESFFIDHGTGVVIGETTIIGKNVKLYQNVTLGAMSVPAFNRERKIERENIEKRHPTIEDNCIIYSGATILGGNTVIGGNSVIGGNVWLTHSLPAHSKIFSNQHELNYISSMNSQNI